jgi:hypothetical protein
VNIPSDAVIPVEKLTLYLLVPRVLDDKSKFLSIGGFSSSNPGALSDAIRTLNEVASAFQFKESRYGTYYRVEGKLMGVNSVNLSVTTIWIKRKIDGKFQFITLVPGRRGKG